MKINTLFFIDELNKVFPSTKDSCFFNDEIEDIVYFKDNYIFAINDNSIITNEFKNELNCCVPIRLLLKILNNIKDEFIILEKTENWLVVKTKKHNIKLNIVQIDEDKYFGIMPEHTDTNYQNIPNDFFTGIEKSLFSVSDNSTAGAINCLFFDDGNWVSTDNYRITQYKLSGDVINGTFLLSKKNAIELLNLSNKVCFVCFKIIENKWALFCDEDEKFKFFVLLNDIKFPNYKQVFDNFVAKHKIKFPKELLEIVELNSIISNNDNIFSSDEKITIELTDEKILCKSAGSIANNISELDFPGNKKHISFSPHPKFFLEILKNTNKMQLSNKLLLFSSKKFRHIIVLKEEING